MLISSIVDNHRSQRRFGSLCSRARCRPIEPLIAGRSARIRTGPMPEGPLPCVHAPFSTMLTVTRSAAPMHKDVGPLRRSAGFV